VIPDEVVFAACDAVRLSRDHAGLVRTLVRDPEGRWPRCCAGDCDPCMQAITRAALRTLEALGTPRSSPAPALG